MLSRAKHEQRHWQAAQASAASQRTGRADPQQDGRRCTVAVSFSAILLHNADLLGLLASFFYYFRGRCASPVGTGRLAARSRWLLSWHSVAADADWAVVEAVASRCRAEASAGGVGRVVVPGCGL